MNWRAYRKECAAQDAEKENSTMETKHTPGPWHVATKSVNAKLNGWQRHFLVIGSMSPASIQPALVPCGDGENGEANARLIAAAPELLEALENLAYAFKALNEDYDVNAHYNNAMAAIAKAEGR